MKNLHSSGKLDYIDLNIHSSKYRKNSTYEAPTCFQPLGWTRLCREASYRDPELYEKYQGDGPGIAPEWRLLFAVMGSAFMVAYNNNSTKTDNNLNDILRNNPELIKDFDQSDLGGDGPPLFDANQSRTQGGGPGATKNNFMQNILGQGLGGIANMMGGF